MRRIMSVLRRARRTVRYLSLAVCCAVGYAGASKADADASCDAAVIRAAQVADVPVDILRAFARAASGHTRNGTLVPWPWSVRVEGTQHQFETREAASRFVFAHFMRGTRSFDVGCFQLSYTASGAAFGSVEEMFDPQANALFAADRLRRLHTSTGSWVDAVRASFAQRPETDASDHARFERIFLSLPPLQPSPSGNLQAPATIRNRTNQPIVDTRSSASMVQLSDAAASTAAVIQE